MTAQQMLMHVSAHYAQSLTGNATVFTHMHAALLEFPAAVL